MKSKEVIADGQISMFDMQFTEKPKKVTEVAEKITKTDILSTEILNKVTSKKMRKS